MQNKERIIFLIDEIKERFESLQGTSSELMNMDIILEDLRFVYRDIELIKLKVIRSETIKEVEDVDLSENLNNEVKSLEEEKPADEIHNHTEDVKASPPPFAPSSGQFDDSNKDTVDQPIIEDNEIKKDSPRHFEDESKAAPPPPPANNFDNASMHGDVGKSPLFVADKLRVEDNSLYKKFLLINEDKSIGSRMQVTPIKNIKEAIGLNEKFLFINELFSGNIQDYNIAVEKLNGFQNLENAFDYLNELGTSCNWDFDRSENTIRMLVNLVQRRYVKE